MSINKFFKIILKKIWVLLLGIFIFSIMGFVISKFIIKPTYASDGLVYVSSVSENANNSDLTYNKSLVDSYIIIISSDIFLDYVQAEITASNITYTNDELRDMVKTKKNMESFTITISNRSAEHAHIICTSFLKNVQAEAPKIVGNVKDKAVSILNQSRLATKPSSPNVLLYTAIFFLLGAILSVLAILLLDKMDDRVKNEDDLRENFNVPILGVIYDNLQYVSSEDVNEDK